MSDTRALHLPADTADCTAGQKASQQTNRQADPDRVATAPSNQAGDLTDSSHVIHANDLSV